ncbi:DUF6602 domain-containing protein [Flavobacterium sp. PL02]|uniref:DUF6602 domain-containing protein n=1 Tax=Flavobacterium sp. PL02 TaxID=3088354 RepID=UPI002B223794|nr:DUF6602 domain-containing protein [Flavobacterium sp. PL02]MEA9414302.1 DUF6602 domain-containing protein [Flavobacterium sp. PL02]
MIHSIADLLKEFVAAEVEILNSYDMKHPTTIGTMFEGLTQEIFEKTIFKGLDLKIIKNSFIVGCDTEFDVMLVEGSGEKIPKTDRYKYTPEKVIAIVQSKKNLYTKDLKGSNENLKFLVDYYENIKVVEPYIERLFRDSFRTTCRKDITAKNLGELTLEEEYIYHTLRIEALLPVRIVWGYNGFKSEFNFRESFVDYINENLTTDFNNKIGYFGPHNFPNMIICNNLSIIKANGMPVISPMLKDKYWPFLITSSYNPTYFFLELIWTRLSYKYELPMEIFGEDLDMEPANRFLDCRLKKIDQHIGWEFNYFEISNTTLKSNTEINKWQPIELDIIQFEIITQLCVKSEIDIETCKKDIEENVLKEGYESVEVFFDKLIDTGLIVIENKKIKLLTQECQCAITSDGRLVAGENNSGRFSNWFNNQLQNTNTSTLS